MKIYRYEVPVDDQVHEFKLDSHPLHVACRTLDVVEFWAEKFDFGEPEVYYLKVFGTGQQIVGDWHYIGTAIAPGGSLVWHLMENWGND